MKKPANTSLQKHSLIFLFSILFGFHSFSQSDYYWVGGTGNWSDFANHWATTSGGSVFHTSSPTSVDDVYFDANSFDAPDQVVTQDIQGFSDNRIHSMDWRGSMNNPSLVRQGSGEESTYLRIHGSVYFHENMTVDIAISLQILSDGENAEFDSGGVDLSNSEISYQVSTNASLSLLDSLSAKSFDTGNTMRGSFTSNGHPIHVTDVFSIDNNILAGAIFDISNTRIYAKSFEVDATFEGELNTSGTSVTIIYPDGSTKIYLDDTQPFFENYTIKEDHLFRKVNSLAATFYFDNLIIEPGVELLIDDEINGIVFENLIANGTADMLISIKSDNPGTAARLVKSSGEVNLNYVALQDIEATGGATFNAFLSVNNGNVTGFNFLKLDQEIAFDLDLQDLSYENVGELIDLSATVNSDLEITYTSSDDNVALITESGQLEVVGVGTVDITAFQIGNEFYFAADPVVRALEVTKADQVISMEIPDTWIGDGLTNITASSDSELLLSYQIDGPATINGSVLTLTGVGTVQVTASQAGNDNYFAAPNVIIQFEVYKKAQVITFAEIQDTSEDAGFVNLDATSDSGLEVAYSVVGPGEVVDGAMEFTGNGMVQITAKQEGNDLYLEAEMVRRSFEILSSTTEKPLFLTQPEGLGTVYPNPVADYLYFDPQIKIEHVRLSDLSGKIFYDGELSNEFLDVSSFDIGTYVVSITTDDGDKIVKRIIKD